MRKLPLQMSKAQTRSARAGDQSQHLERPGACGAEHQLGHRHLGGCLACRWELGRTAKCGRAVLSRASSQALGPSSTVGAARAPARSNPSHIAQFWLGPGPLALALGACLACPPCLLVDLGVMISDALASYSKLLGQPCLAGPPRAGPPRARPTPKGFPMLQCQDSDHWRNSDAFGAWRPVHSRGQQSQSSP